MAAALARVTGAGEAVRYGSSWQPTSQGTLLCSGAGARASRVLYVGAISFMIANCNFRCRLPSIKNEAGILDMLCILH